MRLRKRRLRLETLLSPSSSMKPWRFERYSNSRLIMRLIADERLEQVVGKRHVAAGFPVADGLRFLEFAVEGDFWADVKPEREVRAQRGFVDAVQIIAADAANGGARDQREDVAVGEDDQAGAQRGKNAALELVEEIGAVHQRQRHARDGIFGEQAVDVFTDKVRAAQAHGLHGEAFGFEPFGEQRNLRGAAGTVRAFDHDQRAAEFFRFYAGQRRAVEARR